MNTPLASSDLPTGDEFQIFSSCFVTSGVAWTIILPIFDIWKFKYIYI